MFPKLAAAALPRNDGRVNLSPHTKIRNSVRRSLAMWLSVDTTTCVLKFSPEDTFISILPFTFLPFTILFILSFKFYKTLAPWKDLIWIWPFFRTDFRAFTHSQILGCPELSPKINSSTHFPQHRHTYWHMPQIFVLFSDLKTFQSFLWYESQWWLTNLLL